MKTIKRKIHTVPGFREAVARRCSGRPDVSVWIAEALVCAARSRTIKPILIHRAQQSDGEMTLRFQPEENGEINGALKEHGTTNFSAWARSVIMALPVTNESAKPAITIQRCIASIDYPQFDMAHMLNIHGAILEHLRLHDVSAETLYQYYLIFKQLEEDVRKIVHAYSKLVTGNSAPCDHTSSHD